MQNRVDTFGTIISTKARGSWMGNRGIIHNDKQEIVRSFKLNAWITCKLDFKGWKRAIMAPNRYTELFFLDEATAFAAGHRPCSECRRNDFNNFKTLWLKGNPGYQFTGKTSIQELDKVLNKERKNNDGSKKTYLENTHLLPDGTFISFENNAWLLFNHQMHLWSPFGYKECLPIPLVDKLTVLTPGSVVNTFRAGYLPQMNISQDH